ncbi:MAG TPA: hypothetical protein VLA64_07750, partial [Azonexus sp.]|nr:hypothetical protein [Azonexus sp.]
RPDRDMGEIASESAIAYCLNFLWPYGKSGKQLTGQKPRNRGVTLGEWNSHQHKLECHFSGKFQKPANVYCPKLSISGQIFPVGQANLTDFFRCLKR